MADDPTNNTQWVILAICGGLVVMTAIILLAVFCCCGICGRAGMCAPGGGGGGMCFPQGQQVVMIAQPGQNPLQPTGPGGGGMMMGDGMGGANPVPDPTRISDLNAGGNLQFNNTEGKMGQMGGSKLQLYKLQASDPTTAVRQVARQYYNVPDPNQVPPPDPEPPMPNEPPVPTYLVQDSGYASGRAAPPYQIIRSRDPDFDRSRWAPPWQRRK